jgi:rhodanese-related sulfurtransferase
MRARVLIVGAAIALLLSCVASADPAAPADPTTVGNPAAPADITDYLEPDALRSLAADLPDETYLVDVRTPGEYGDGHIPGAINIELSALADNPPTPEKGALIIVYCRSGSRSARAAQTLKDLGYTGVLDWGGIIRWPYETVSGPDPR